MCARGPAPRAYAAIDQQDGKNTILPADPGSRISLRARAASASGNSLPTTVAERRFEACKEPGVDVRSSSGVTLQERERMNRRGAPSTHED